MANSAELITYTALRGLASGRIYPDVAPLNTVRPFVAYQAVGGQSSQPLNGGSGIRNSRMQINVWADTRSTATALMNDVIAALANDTVKAVAIGEPVSDYEPDTTLFGSRLDFSIWYYL